MDATVVRFEERTELVGNHDVDRQAALHRAERVCLDVPGAVAPRTLAQPIDIAADRLERDDRPLVQDLVAQEVVILADICANIEDAVDVLLRQHGARWRAKSWSFISRR